ncbi:GCN5-related N-acetyltransferase [Shewanella denitrificans OS217]|jgi:GNAT superfamily N-acetyltransferase|uniref:GCN5-related N-acetyltransferase n=1 Tax=Shewanella denitrificans (strain OS217 / ATCC BAA-1090 / DSM 15013) TaxID=318161 RepID=Q12PG2_SHEDO|nr:GNAT family N-acetyltransferase [Shewanella denitrificans]ABE54664.1 GCN5-related N-acetyltransferase [Shewanella denitrificans OS217]
MKIDIINEEATALVDTLVAGVRQYNVDNMGDETSKPLTVVAHDDEGKLLGGVSGRTIYKNFLINVVWVHEQARGTGLGRELMQLAEVAAKDRGCLLAQVDTLSFQAPVFYQKLGFEIVGRVPQIADIPERFFLMKTY